MKTPIVYLDRRRSRRSLAHQRARAALPRQADVVIYDHLVHERLLRHARPDAERIDVGAGGAGAARAGSDLLPARREGARGQGGRAPEVGRPVRLRPRRRGSAVPARAGRAVRGRARAFRPPSACPAYAGIPITYPGGGDTVTFVRGHEAEQARKPHVDWTSLRKLGGTVVCYCGPASSSHGCSTRCCRTAGRRTRPRRSSTTARCRRRRPSQATLGELADAGPAAASSGTRRSWSSAASPALREHLRWFDARPLFGKRIVVTRPREQAAELVESLEELGATVIEAPTIRIVAAGGFRRRSTRRVPIGRPVRLDRVHERQRRGLLHPAAARRARRRAGARGRQALRDRPGHRRAPGAARPEGRT